MAHELDKRLRDVETGQATLQKAVEIHLEQTTKIIERHDRTLFHTEKGLAVRLDREEQKSKNITRSIWLIAAAFISFAFKLGYDAFQHFAN